MNFKHLLISLMLVCMSTLVCAQKDDNQLLAGTWVFEHMEAEVICNRSNVKKLIEKKLIEDGLANLNSIDNRFVFDANGTFKYFEISELVDSGKFTYSAANRECTIESGGELIKMVVILKNDLMEMHSPQDESEKYTPDELERLFKLENASKIKVSRAVEIAIMKKL